MSIIDVLKNDDSRRLIESPERLIALSDGIFAVAITLLVLDIATVPEGLTTSSKLIANLQSSESSIISYIISFLVIGIYWRVHHQIFQRIKRSDAVLFYLNLLLMMMIAFLPVPTGYLGHYGNEPVAVLFYAPVVALTGLLLWAMWIYATTNHRLVEPDLSPELIRHYSINFLIAPIVVLLSMLLVNVNVFSPAIAGPDLAKYFWILSIPLRRINVNLHRKRIRLQDNAVDKAVAQKEANKVENTDDDKTSA